MTAAQIQKAIKIAFDESIDSNDVNTEPLHGIACIGAAHVTVTLVCVGVFLRDFILWNGKMDDAAINDLSWVLRHRVTALDTD